MCVCKDWVDKREADWMRGKNKRNSAEFKKGCHPNPLIRKKVDKRVIKAAFIVSLYLS